MILHHLRAGQYDGTWTDAAVRRFAAEMGPLLRDLLDLSRADVTSKRPGKRQRCLAQISELARRIADLAEQDAKVPRSRLASATPSWSPSRSLLENTSASSAAASRRSARRASSRPDNPPIFILMPRAAAASPSRSRSSHRAATATPEPAGAGIHPTTARTPLEALVHAGRVHPDCRSAHAPATVEPMAYRPTSASPRALALTATTLLLALSACPSPDPATTDSAATDDTTTGATTTDAATTTETTGEPLDPACEGLQLPPVTDDGCAPCPATTSHASTTPPMTPGPRASLTRAPTP